MNARSWLVVFAAGLLLAAAPPKVGSDDKEENGIQGRWVAEKVGFQ
jgi:hypothetical protein